MKRMIMFILLLVTMTSRVAHAESAIVTVDEFAPRASASGFPLPDGRGSVALYPFDNPKQTSQFHHLLYDLRCPVCQNQDLADSNAGLAKDLRQEIYQLVTEGKSDDEIIRYMTARYGDFILFKPPVKAVTLLLWFGPLLFIIIGLLMFYYTCIRRAKHASV